MDKNATGLYEGEIVKIKGEEYIVPGLSLGQVEQFAGKIESIAANGGVLNAEMVQSVSEITHAAMSRNYPAITLEEVKDMLDMRNMKTVMEAVMGASGFVKNTLEGGTGAKGATLKRN